MKKIYIITNPMPQLNRSAEVTLSKFLRVIRQANFNYEVIGGNVTLEEDLNNISIVSWDVNKTGNKLRRLLSMIAFELETGHYVAQTIHAGDVVFFWLGDKMIVPFIVAKRNRAKINYYVYGNVSNESRKSIFSKIYSRLIAYMAKRADNVFVESESVLDGWRKQIKNITPQIMHLYVDRIHFSPLENRKCKMGMICRISNEKHVRECIQAFVNFKKANPAWELEIIGSGNDMQNCSDLINDNNAMSYIHMLGWRTHKEIEQICEKWKYFLLVSDDEGLPNGLIEAMGMGLVPITHPVGGIADIVVDGENGFFVKDTSPDSIYDAMCVASSAKNYAQLSRNAFLTISENFTLEQSRQISARLLETLI